MRPEQEDDFRAFAAAAIPSLRRLAVAVSRDPSSADDLVQATLEKMYVAWPRLGDIANPHAYARTALVRSLVDEKRRWWTRNVHVTDTPPDVGRLDDAIEGLGDDERMLAALRTLTPRQRAAVVLRHVEGLSVPEVAETTGLSPTNVKAATREGLALLRRALGAPDEENRTTAPTNEEEHA